MTHRTRLKIRSQSAITAALMLLWLAGPLSLVKAQDAPWSAPSLIFATNGDTGSMAMITDQAGGVHLFFAHRPEETDATGIDHLYWDGETWLGPNSIIVNADGSNVGHISAAIDSEQAIHLIWGGGRNQLYYASAPAADAASALSWSQPAPLGAAITEAGIAVAPDGTLVVAFSNADAIGTVSVTTSFDGGQTWSTPTPAALTPTGIAPDAVSVAVDGAGRLHLTWTGATLPSGDPLVGVFYARSLDSGLTWSEPQQIDDDRHGEIRAGTVGENEIHLVWRSNIGGDGTFHQWSPDGGDTWSDVNQYDDRGGVSGLPSFAVDSTDRIHYVIGPAFATYWQEGSLAPYIDVAGSDLRTGANQEPGWTHPERAVIGITGGNRLHVIFETGFNKLWHVQRQLDVPEIPPLPLPIPEAAAAVGQTIQKTPPDSETTPASTSTTVERPEIDAARSQASIGMAQIMLISIGPVVLLVGLVVIMQTRRTLRR